MARGPEGSLPEMALSPERRSLVGRIGAHASWAATSDPSARTQPGRSAFLDRFAREVDPDSKLSEPERQRRADHARKAYFAKLALQSAKARAGRRGERA